MKTDGSRGIIEWTLVRSKRKTLSVEVRADGSVVVRAPMRTPLGRIEAFVRDRTPWIESHVAKMAERRARYGIGPYDPSGMTGAAGPSGPYDPSGPSGQPGQPGMSGAGGAVPVLTAEELNVLARAAAKDLPARAARFAPRLGVTYGRITIRCQKTRWGSCSAAGNLNFNCLLMLAPEEIRDYVVVHELAHRLEMNHSPRFWAQVEKVLPDWRQRRAWLKENGGALMLRAGRA